MRALTHHRVHRVRRLSDGWWVCGGRASGAGVGCDFRSLDIRDVAEHVKVLRGVIRYPKSADVSAGAVPVV